MRRALLIGIDQYDYVTPLTGCVADATKLRDLLYQNDDGSPNYDCRVLTSPGPQRITRAYLRSEWYQLFRNFKGDILFYFSGHGTPTEIGGHLVVQDGTLDDPGLSMNDLLLLANQSRAQEVLLILDCCFSGELGNPSFLQSGGIVNQAQLREGVTILAASGPKEFAKEQGGHGVFTSLLLGALSGGAADVRGEVSAAAIYTYVEQALGPWDQRPIYKSYANTLSPVRRCKPFVSDDVLRELSLYFPRPDSRYKLDPTYEPTHKPKVAKNVEIFIKFKMYRDARLLRSVKGLDLYFTAMKYGYVELTSLGQLYWHLAKDRRF
ncbi:MAG TPA: caspase family protein [Blastocatellia bacterium]